jgi:hypothetical protein
VTATLKKIVENLSSEPSTPPYDLRYNWTPTNDLELRWKHPNETNGDIMLFYVTLLPTVPNVTPYFGKVSVSKLNYMLDYHHRVSTEYIRSVYSSMLFRYLSDREERFITDN